MEEGYSRPPMLLLLFRLADDDLFLLMKFEMMFEGDAGGRGEAEAEAALLLDGWTWTMGVDERVRPRPLLDDGRVGVLLPSLAVLVLLLFVLLPALL